MKEAHLKAYDFPLSVEAIDGEIVVTGQAVAVALTPTAALETARRLKAAAEAALTRSAAAQAWQTAASDR